MAITILILSIIVSIISFKNTEEKKLGFIFPSIFISVAIAALANELGGTVLSIVKKQSTENSTLAINIKLINAFLTQFTEHIIVILVFAFCLTYTNHFKNRTQRILITSAIILSTISFLLFPILTNYQKVQYKLYKYYYISLSIWSIPVILFSCLIMYLSYKKETSEILKIRKKLELILILPLGLGCTINLLILRALGFRKPWVPNGYFVILELLLILFFITKYNIFGINSSFLNKLNCIKISRNIKNFFLHLVLALSFLSYLQHLYYFLP